MKKTELIKAITAEVDISADKAGQVINLVFENIAKALENGDSYNQDNFGTFKIVERAARKGRNPQTKEVIDIPAKKAVKMVISAHLKNSVNK